MVDRRPWHDEEDQNPVFKILHAHFRSRGRARAVLLDIAREGFVILRQGEAPSEPKAPSLTDMALAAASKRE